MIDTTQYKPRLEEMLAVVTNELKDLGIHNPEVKEDWIATPARESTEADPNLEADRVEDWNERRAILAELETRYNNLNRALQKIETETYGICEICNEPISTDRLAANPAARTCQEHLNEEADLPR